MKKVLVVLLVVALSLSGCAGFLKFSQQVQDKLCNPPANVMMILEQAAPIVQAIISMAVPGSAAFIAAVNAKQVIDSIQGGACVTVTQLNNLITFLQSADAKKEMSKTKAVVNVQALQDWSKGIKK